MSSPAELGLDRWHAAVAARDEGMLPAMIAEDAVFRSPAVHGDQTGHALVVAYLSAAFTVLGPALAYHDEWVREADAVLRFTTVVNDREIEGIDMIRWNADGLIAEFTVMVRPIRGLESLIEAMGAELMRRLG